MNETLSDYLSTCQGIIYPDLDYKILTEKQKFTAISVIFSQINSEKEDPEIL